MTVDWLGLAVGVCIGVAIACTGRLLIGGLLGTAFILAALSVTFCVGGWLLYNVPTERRR